MDTAIGGAVSEIVGDTVGAAVGDYGSCRSPTAAGSDSSEERRVG